MSDIRALATVANQTAAYEKRAGAKNVEVAKDVYEEGLPTTYKDLGAKGHTESVWATYNKGITPAAQTKQMKALGFTPEKYDKKTINKLKNEYGTYALEKDKNGTQYFQSLTSDDAITAYKNKKGQGAVINRTNGSDGTSIDTTFFNIKK